MDKTDLSNNSNEEKDFTVNTESETVLTRSEDIHGSKQDVKTSEVKESNIKMNSTIAREGLLNKDRSNTLNERFDEDVICAEENTESDFSSHDAMQNQLSEIRKGDESTSSDVNNISNAQVCAEGVMENELQTVKLMMKEGESTTNSITNNKRNVQGSSTIVAEGIIENDLQIGKLTENNKNSGVPENCVAQSSALNLLLDYGVDSSDGEDDKDCVIISSSIKTTETNGRYRSQPSLVLSDEETSSSSSSSIHFTGNSIYESDDSSDEDSSDDDAFFVSKKKDKEPAPELQERYTKTNGELTLDDLPPIKDLCISVPEDQCVLFGHIMNIVDKLVIVKGLKENPAVNLDSILFLGSNKPLGEVFDVFGSVSEPMYCVRFNSNQQIKEKAITVGMPVYYAPKSEYTSYVFLNQLMKIKGSDASWEDNNEPPLNCVDYSDDEEERRVRRMKKDHLNKRCAENFRDEPERKKLTPYEQRMNEKNLLMSEIQNQAQRRRPWKRNNNNMVIRPPIFVPPDSSGYNRSPVIPSPQNPEGSKMFDGFSTPGPWSLSIPPPLMFDSSVPPPQSPEGMRPPLDGFRPQMNRLHPVPPEMDFSNGSPSAFQPFGFPPRFDCNRVQHRPFQQNIPRWLASDQYSFEAQQNHNNNMHSMNIPPSPTVPPSPRFRFPSVNSPVHPQQGFLRHPMLKSNNSVRSFSALIPPDSPQLSPISPMLFPSSGNLIMPNHPMMFSTPPPPPPQQM